MSKQNQDGFPDRNNGQNVIDRIKDYIQQNGFCWSSKKLGKGEALAAVRGGLVLL